MNPGRRDFYSADFGGMVPKVVLFDFIRTLICPYPSFGEQLARIYYRVARIRATPAHALGVTETVHRQMQERRTGDATADWVLMNRMILSRLAGCALEQISMDVAHTVHQLIIGTRKDAKVRYTVRPAMRRLLGRLHGRVPLGIATTQPWEIFQRQLDEFGLRGYFEPTLLFSSESIGPPGEKIYKPTARFWQIVQRTVGYEAGWIPLVGDSLATDAPATEFGHPVFLLDTCGHQAPYVPPHPLLFLCRSTTQVEAQLVWLGLPR